MSNIRNKISSIEADDDVVTRSLGLRPAEETEATPEKSDVNSEADKKVAETEADKVRRPTADEPVPAIITRRRDLESTDG